MPERGFAPPGILPYVNPMRDNAASANSCPICGKPTEQAFKPFCSKRCADIDLNRWLSGVYAVPAKDEDDEDGERPQDAGAGEA
jgi:uncharacterized protein